jgi:hypothetical protein
MEKKEYLSLLLVDPTVECCLLGLEWNTRTLFKGIFTQIDADFNFTQKNHNFRAIAASAPILEFEGMTKCSAFNRILTSDYETASGECRQSIRKSWDALNQLAKSSKI